MMLRRAGVAVVAVFLFSTASSVCAQSPDEWWKQRAANRLDERGADARITWDRGFLEVKAGATADPALVLNPAHGRSLAARAARALAYAKLAEIVEGVRIDGVTVVKNAMVVDSTVRATVQGFIRGAVATETVVPQPDGSPWVDVVMRLPLRGPGSLSESVAGWAASRPADAYRGDARFPINEPYTGVIIEASESSFLPSIMPRVLEQASGKAVYGPHLVQPTILGQYGAVGYAVAMVDAAREQRVGRNPLIVRALPPTDGAKPGEIVLSTRDAERVAAADRAGKFLERAAVIVVRGADAAQQAAQPGRRHALVIGVQDYQQGYKKLTHTVGDARAFADVLRTAGRFPSDAVTFIENGTRTEILAALNSLRARVGDDDTVVIFFAGHGTLANGPDGRPHYFLVPRDGVAADIGSTGLRDDQLEEPIGALKARRIVVVLDACYSGGGSSTIRARAAAAQPSVAAPPRAPIEPSAGRIVLSASQPDQPAYEDDRRGGVFTSFLIEGLRGAADANRDGKISALELYDYVSTRVTEYTRHHHRVEQTPVLEVRGLAGQIVLATP
jgi:hypothetical protein